MVNMGPFLGAVHWWESVATSQIQSMKVDGNCPSSSSPKQWVGWEWLFQVFAGIQCKHIIRQADEGDTHCPLSDHGENSPCHWPSCLSDGRTPITLNFLLLEVQSKD